MKKFWTIAVALFLAVVFIALLSNDFDVNAAKYDNSSQLAMTPPIKPPAIPPKS
jgi:hypothetical protein